MKILSISLTICLLIAVGVCSPAADPLAHSRNAIQTGDDLVEQVYADCLNKGSASCVKYKLFSFVDKVLGSKDSFALSEGVTVVKTPGAISTDGAPRSLSAEDYEKADLDTLVADRVERFLNTHTLKMDLKGSDIVDAVSSAGRALSDVSDSFGLTSSEPDGIEEARGKKKVVKKAGKILLPLLMMMKMKAAMLLPLILGAIALLAGKALLIGKIALLLSAIIGLKKLLSQQHKSVTYEIVSHPHHSSSHEVHHDHGFSSGGDVGGYGGGGGGGGHGGWGRSAQDLAYRGYQPKKQQ